MASYPNPRGPAPKPASQRRRYAKPQSHGAAEPTTAPPAKLSDRQLGIDDAHPLIMAMWDTVQQSCEAAFYSEADWQRLRLELWFANRTLASGQPSANAWTAIQSGMNEMLLSPAIKRRAGIEVKRAAVDADEVAADAQIARYRAVLTSV